MTTPLPDGDWDAFTCHRCGLDYQFCECEEADEAYQQDEQVGNSLPLAGRGRISTSTPLSDSPSPGLIDGDE